MNTTMILDAGARYVLARLTEMTERVFWKDQMPDGREVDVVGYEPIGLQGRHEVTLSMEGADDPTLALIIQFVALYQPAFESDGDDFENSVGAIIVHPLGPERCKVDFGGDEMVEACFSWIAERLHTLFAEPNAGPQRLSELEIAAAASALSRKPSLEPAMARVYGNEMAAVREAARLGAAGDGRPEVGSTTKAPEAEGSDGGVRETDASLSEAESGSTSGRRAGTPRYRKAERLAWLKLWLVECERNYNDMVRREAEWPSQSCPARDTLKRWHGDFSPADRKEEGLPDER